MAAIGDARPETVPVLVRTAGEEKRPVNKRKVSARIVAGMDAAEALNTGKRPARKRIAGKR